jgi:tetrahydromethanopterin S-methyltransferase subunit G
MFSKRKPPEDQPSLDEIGASLEAELAAETKNLETRSQQRADAVSKEQESAASVMSGQRRLAAYRQLTKLAYDLREDTPGTEKAIRAIEKTIPETPGQLTKKWLKKGRNIGIIFATGVGVGLLTAAYNNGTISTDEFNINEQNLTPEALQQG